MHTSGSCASGPCDDAFAAQLTPSGSALRYSSFLGGGKDEEGEGIAVDSNGLLHMAGWTQSSSFPTLNGFDTTFGGGSCSGEPCPDGFLASIDPSLSGTGSLRYSTFLGGNNWEQALDLALDSSGKVYLTGYTRSSNFPVKTPFQPSRTGNRDAFLTKVDPSLSGASSLRYSTFLGGADDDRGAGVAVDSEGSVYLAGLTRSDNFPLANPLQAARSGGTCTGEPCSDAFASKLDLGSNNLLFSTYLGGTGDDEAQAITVDASNQAFLAGFTKSLDFPLADPFQAQKGTEGCSAPPCTDAFVTAINPSGGALLYSSYLGGSKDDYAYDLALDGQGEAYLTGETYSTDFPTTPGAYDVILEGTKRDAFVVKVSQASTPEQQTRVIHYTYDPLSRLTAADYDDGTYFHYTYDPVGNRLSETTPLGTTTYSYDIANRLTAVNAVSYTWDDNGNLLNDGVNTYSYDRANRLVTAIGPGYTSSYGYNGLGDRLQQTVNSVTTNYTLDLASGLTQVLADGVNTYLYGRGRIAQLNTGTQDTDYFLGDVLGSVRQLADANGAATLAQAYEPYGEVSSAAGDEVTNYAFAGEWQDAGTGLIYLRARWLSTQTGRFLTQDTWGGNARQPMSYNDWLYGYANPVNLTDSSGYCPDDDGDGKCANTNPYKAVCSRLTGNDYLACEKIIRGINPDISLPIGLIKALGGLRNCRELANFFSPPRLPQDYQTDTTQFGYWFHWLAENVPGWWNENGDVDVSIQQLIAIAYGRETSSMISVQRYREAVSEAFARKTWAAGFYYYIGSRQAVQTIVEYGIFGMDCKGWCAKNYSPTKFVEQLSGYDFGPDGEAFEQAGRILTRGDWRTRMDNKPWEFGNPTDNSPETFKKALHQGNIGDGPSQVYYFNIPWEQRSRAWSDTENNWVYNIAIVVTPAQVSNLCNNASCLGR